MLTEVGAPPHRVRSIIGDVVADMSAVLDESASVVAGTIHENVSELSDDLYAATRQSTRANIGLITTMVASGAEPTVFTAPEEALSYARGYVHEGLSLECLSRVYRH